MKSAKQKNSSSIDDVIGNDDLLTQILLRMPAKSVLRSKLVSKKWLSIISDSCFAIQHTHLNPHTPSALLLTRPRCYSLVSLDGKSLVNISSGFLNVNPNNPRRTYVSQSCNGLLLCYNRRGYSHLARTKPIYFILNPATRHLVMLPPLPTQRSRRNRTRLMFDPSKSPHYHVLCTQFLNSVLEIHVYSSETKEWKLSVKQENFDTLSVNFANGVFWNGAIHWISLVGNGFSFLLDKECLQTIPRPPLPENWQNKNFGYFGESAGHLHFIGFLPGNQNPGDLNMGIISPNMFHDQVANSNTASIFPDKTIVVYAMEKGCSKWFVKYCLYMDAIAMAYTRIIEDPTLSTFSVKVLSLIEGNDETGAMLVMRIPGEIISYSFKDKTFKNIFSFAPSRHATCYAFKYTETVSWV